MDNEKEIQEIDIHVQKHIHKSASFKSGQTATVVDVCAYWQIARPIILFASKYLLFWKPKWQDAVAKFVEVADSLCPPAV